MGVKEFWMVLGDDPPVFHHDSPQSAIQEAERLAQNHRGKTFTVLKSIASVKFNAVQWQEHESIDAECDIPF